MLARAGAAGMACRCSAGVAPPSSGWPRCPASALPRSSSATGRVPATRPRAAAAATCAASPGVVHAQACGRGPHRVALAAARRRAPRRPAIMVTCTTPRRTAGDGGPGVPGPEAAGGARRRSRAVRVAGPRTAIRAAGARPVGRTVFPRRTFPSACSRTDAPLNSRLRTRPPTARLSLLSPPAGLARRAGCRGPRRSAAGGLAPQKDSASCLRRRPAGGTWSPRRCS